MGEIEVRKIRVIAALAVFIILMGVMTAQAVSGISLSEKNSGQTVSLKLGSQVSLTLHSMYWAMIPQVTLSSLVAKGAPILKPVLPGPSAPNGCQIAGSGCGTQTWKFVASRVGTAHMIATRTTCGEAMKCTGSAGRFEVTVKVSR
jgi:hypothetical protein